MGRVCSEGQKVGWRVFSTAALEAVKQRAKRGSDPCILQIAVCEGLCSAGTHKLSLTFTPVSGLWSLKDVAGIQVGLCQEGHRGPRTGETVKQSSEGRKEEKTRRWTVNQNQNLATQPHDLEPGASISCL